MTGGGDPDGFGSAWAGPFDLPPLGHVPGEEAHKARRRQFAEYLYGPVPPPPDSLTISRTPLAGEAAERIVLTLTVEDRRFEVDAALWLPEDRGQPAPLICGLDFAGPAGVLTSDSFPLDPDARIYSRPEFGAREGRLDEVLRGTSAYRWPVGMMLRQGYAVLVSCYGSWTPDDAYVWHRHGVHPLLGPKAGTSGAISLWAWALARLVDAAGDIPQIDASRIAVAGHSRLGKAALWVAANDTRIGAVLANNAGCGGTAPARHAVGETLDQMAERFPHWLGKGIPHTLPPVDQHQLIALAAPRAVYVASAADDLWADPLGSYQALRLASEAWGDDPALWPTPAQVWRGERETVRGALGHHIRPGGHDLLPFDWRRFLRFLGRQTAFADGGQGQS